MCESRSFFSILLNTSICCQAVDEQVKKWPGNLLYACLIPPIGTLHLLALCFPQEVMVSILKQYSLLFMVSAHYCHSGRGKLGVCRWPSIDTWLLSIL